MSLYRHVIWDWNGTLFDDAWLCVEIINQLLDRHGLPSVSHERYQEVFGFPLRDYCRRLGFDFRVDSFEQLSDEFIEVYEERRLECRLQPDAIEILTRMSESGMGQSILSAYRQQTLEEIVAHFRIERFFVALIGVDNHYGEGKIGRGKYWLEELSCPGDEVVLVGDTVHDCDVASAMGVDCILVPSGHQARQKLAASDARVVERLAEVGALLQVGSLAADGSKRRGGR